MSKPKTRCGYFAGKKVISTPPDLPDILASASARTETEMHMTSQMLYNQKNVTLSLATLSAGTIKLAFKLDETRRDHRQLALIIPQLVVLRALSQDSAVDFQLVPSDLGTRQTVLIPNENGRLDSLGKRLKQELDMVLTHIGQLTTVHKGLPDIKKDEGIAWLTELNKRFTQSVTDKA